MSVAPYEYYCLKCSKGRPEPSPTCHVCGGQIAPWLEFVKAEIERHRTIVGMPALEDKVAALEARLAELEEQAKKNPSPLDEGL